MSAQCICRNPTPSGDGEQEHCTRCGAWTAAAIAAHYERKAREAPARRAAGEGRTDG